MGNIDDLVKVSPFCSADNQCVEYIYEDCRTELEAFYRGFKLSDGDGICMGVRPTDLADHYDWLTYREVDRKIKQFGSSLINSVGLSPGQDTKLGIYSNNHPEWDISVLACHLYSVVPVPLYDTLGGRALEFIIKQTEISVIIVDTSAKLLKLLALDKHIIGGLKTIVIIEDNPDVEAVQQIHDLGIEVRTFSEVEKEGSVDPTDTQLATPDSIATILYTSGTTGDPKGVMLTHRNLIAVASSLSLLVEPYKIPLKVGDRYMSYLPAAHGMERNFHGFCFMNGLAIGYFRGDIKRLSSDARALQPQFMPMVPRVLNRLYDAITKKLETIGYVKWFLFNLALSAWSPEYLRSVVFNEVRQQLGGKLSFVCCGSAPLDAKVLDFAKTVLGCCTMVGYGLSEAVAAATVTPPDDPESGHVGFVLPCLSMKLVDVPELDWLADRGAGEVCFKGPSVMAGYYKEPEKTREVIDDEGWLHTGDVGCYTDNGMLKIIDRKKSIFKLSQGEYIAPEKIENILMKINYVAQAFVYGDSLKSSLVGLIFIDEEIFRKNFAVFNNKETAKICTDREVVAKVLEDIHSIGISNGLNSLEQVKAIYIMKDLMTVDEGLLTPTLKSKRPQITRKFKKQLDALYTTV